MTVRQRVRRTQYALVAAHALGAAAWGAAAALLGATVGAPPWMAAVAAVVAAVAALWAWREAFDFDRVALWIEERVPSLRYALVTAIDPRFERAMEPLVRPLLPSTARFVGRTAGRTIAPAFVALSLALLGFLFLPGALAGAARGARGPGDAGPVVNRLASLRVVVTPPAYSGHPRTTGRDLSTITALRGSNVMLEGLDGWTQSVVMRDTLPTLLTLEDRGYRRQIVLDPRIDEPPKVTLRLPARDTALRVVAGNLELAVDVGDDVGLARIHFEYIVSSGEKEDFTFREGILAPRRAAGREFRHTARPAYASLALKEGDRLSVRAVAFDNNTLYGPGQGVSETRTIRVARKDEYEPPNVKKAPPSADTAMLSLRMLIIATEKLEARKDTMERTAFILESRKLASQGESIRRKIQQIIDETTAGGLIQPDTLLVAAHEYMGEGVRELSIASPGGALPPLRAAYKALEFLRNAKRHYIRGAQIPIIVNIERVRAEGASDSGKATPRLPRSAERDPMDALRRSFSRAVNLLLPAPDRALSVLMSMRVATLRSAPPLAGALGDAIAALQAGTDVTLALLHVRRLLHTRIVKLDSLPAWSGAWPP